jgi:hypothetical protein
MLEAMRTVTRSSRPHVSVVRAAPRGEVLEACKRMELEAATIYQRFAARAGTPALRELWREMGEAELSHARAVDSLARRPDLRLPRIGRPELRRIEARFQTMADESESPSLDDAAMVALAAALEFSEMDDLFGTVCQAGGIDPDGGRADHICDLVQAATELGQLGTALRHMLASLIRLDRRNRSFVALPQIVSAG